MAESARGIAGTCMVETAEGPVAPGDLLETAFDYPEGCWLESPAVPRSGVAAAVRAVEPAGEGQVLTGTVRDTHVLFLTAGVLCGE